MNKDELESAKIMHKLSIDHQFAKKQFNKLIKKYEKSKISCGKYFFGLWIDVYINSDDQSNYIKNKFAFQQLSASFLSNDQDKMSQTELNLFREINTLNESEKNDIVKNYLNLIRQNDIKHQDIEYLYIIPNLIRLFYKKGYEFLIIPTTIDFNTDVGLVHQCLILINLKNGGIILYEPYLSYTKYDHDYSYPIKQFFQIYKNVLPDYFIYDKNVIYKNYSDYFDIPPHQGIQSMLLSKNNEKKEEFDKRYDDLMAKIKEEIPKLHEKVLFVQENDKNPVNKTDNTIKILDVIYYFEKWKLQDKFPKIYEEILYIYGMYNSKSCVSLTLIEIDHLLNQISKNNIKKLHTEIKNGGNSNKMVLNKLFLFINS